MNDKKLTILWTNADPDTAEMMVFMYADASLRKQWWERVSIIVWGATAKLVAENEHIRKKLLGLQETGVDVKFCLACATKLGVADQIEAAGFELELMGKPLTEIIKSDGKLLTV